MSTRTRAWRRKQRRNKIAETERRLKARFDDSEVVLTEKQVCVEAITPVVVSRGRRCFRHKLRAARAPEIIETWE